MTEPQARPPADAFAELGRIDVGEMDLATVLAKVAELARRSVPGADDVSITLVGPDGAYTAAFSGQRALTLDERQYQQGQGPCLAAAAATITVSVPDMADDNRWPEWAGRAIDAGVHSSVSVGLPPHESLSGALNVYAVSPHAFHEDAVAVAETFAGYAAEAMAKAPRHDGVAGRTTAAMPNGAVIQQAIGIIMAERRCTAQEASVILAKVSEYAQRALPDVAAALVASAVRRPGR